MRNREENHEYGVENVQTWCVGERGRVKRAPGTVGRMGHPAVVGGGTDGAHKTPARGRLGRVTERP